VCTAKAEVCGVRIMK